MVEALEEELRGVAARIEDAALAGDVEEYLRLTMRQAALPALIREARAMPVQAEIDRLERELDEIEASAQRVRDEPPPTVPPAQRGHVTPLMLQNARLAGVWERSRVISKEIAARRSLLASIRAEAPRRSG